MKPARRQGFTLIETLSIITVIGMLSFILFPVFVKAKDHEGQACCLSHMKQLGLALMMYMGDYDKTYANVDSKVVGSSYEGTSYDLIHSGWANHLNAYVKNPAVFKCPVADNLNKIGVACDYTYNYILGQDGTIATFSNGGEHTMFSDTEWGLANGTPMRETDVDQTAIVAAFWESYNSDRVGDSPNTLSGSNSTMPNGAAHIFFHPSVRHMGGSNVCAVDGHVRHVTWPVKETGTDTLNPHSYAWYKFGPFWTLPKHEWRCIYPNGTIYDRQMGYSSGGWPPVGTGTPVDGSW